MNTKTKTNVQKIHRPEIGGEKDFYDAIHNDHLDAFFFPEKKDGEVWEWYTAYEIGSDGVDNDQFPTLHTDEVLVSSVDYQRHPKLGFVFDFGDDHRFCMEYKGARKFTKEDKRKDFPKVIDQRGIPPKQYQEWEE